MSKRLMAMNRLRKELSELKSSAPVRMSIGPVGDNMFHWEGILHGPEDTPYEGGVFKFTVIFHNDYPMSPPIVKFVTRVYHPNVGSDGSICVDILKNNWSSVYTISQVMLSISSLLSDPNPLSPMNAESARLYTTNRVAYDREVRRFVRLYANPENL